MWAIFPDNMRVIGELTTTSSPLVLAVVGGAMLEEHVERTLSERLRDDKHRSNQIIGTYGALGNLSAQVDVLYLLEAYDEPTRRALQGLVTVRNSFAHNPEMSFDSLDEQFTKAFANLTMHKDLTHYPDRIGGGDSKFKIEPIKTKRDQFTVNLKLALVVLMRDRLSHKLHSNQPLTESELLEIREQLDGK